MISRIACADTSGLANELDAFDRDGFVILKNVISREKIQAIVDALAPYENRPMGCNDFEGERSQRVYSLAGKGKVFQDLAEHPRVLRILDARLMRGFLLSNLQSIRIHPGETT